MASSRLPRGAARAALAGLALALVAASPSLSLEQGLRIVFPEASHLEERFFELGEADRAALRDRLGYAPREYGVSFWEAHRDETPLGHAIVINEIGKTLPITFLVAIRPDGAVDQVLLLAFREPRGGEVEREAFRRQYRDKRLGDLLRRGRDIRNISGATMSVDAMNRGVKRALLFYHHFLGPAPGTRTAADASKAAP